VAKLEAYEGDSRKPFYRLHRRSRRGSKTVQTREGAKTWRMNRRHAAVNDTQKV
jgi:hypothetical protein